MSFRLQGIFSKHTAAIVLAGGLVAMTHADTTPENTAPEWEPISCQRLDAPLSQSDIALRSATVETLQQRIEELKDRPDQTRAVEELEHAKTQLGIFNLLDRLRLSLLDYGDWNELTHKLSNNGVTIDNVCIRGYQYLDLPVVLHENGDGTASLDINFYALSSKPASDGHELVSVTTKSLDEISAALEPEIVSRAIRFAALSGTSPDKAPLLNKTLAVEDLALILTLWQAQAAAEEVLHAADTYARTMDDNAFAAVKADYPYLSGLIDDVRTKTLWAVTTDEALDRDDRTTFRQLAAQTMLNLPDIREQVYGSLLDVMQEMADSDLDVSAYFNHEMSEREMNAAIGRLDESFTLMPVTKIYARWRGSKTDPAQEVIDQMALLRTAAATKKPPQPTAPAP